MSRFNFFLKRNSILTFLSLFCEFEKNLWIKMALITNGLSFTMTHSKKIIVTLNLMKLSQKFAKLLIYANL